MAERRETHAWFDGEGWHLYSERAPDIRRFEAWFGPPTRRGRDGACAHWNALPPDAVRIRRKAHRGSKPPSDKQVQARDAFRAARRASGHAARSPADPFSRDTGESGPAALAGPPS
jgi:hypothetical protein